MKSKKKATNRIKSKKNSNFLRKENPKDSNYLKLKDIFWLIEKTDIYTVEEVTLVHLLQKIKQITMSALNIEDV